MTAKELMVALDNKRAIITDKNYYVFKVRDTYMFAPVNGGLWVDLFYIDRFTAKLKTNIPINKFIIQ
jgi:hypothetical protein